MNTRIFIYISLVLTLLILGLWGYYFYSNRSYPTKQTTNQPLPTQTAKAMSSLSDESSVLNFINEQPEMTLEQRREFYKALDKVGKDTHSITISNCKGEPVVARMKPGEDFTIKNNDQREYTMRLFKKDFTLAANKATSFQTPAQDAFYVYRCTSNKELRKDDLVVGIVYVIPNK